MIIDLGDETLKLLKEYVKTRTISLASSDKQSQIEELKESEIRDRSSGLNSKIGEGTYLISSEATLRLLLLEVQLLNRRLHQLLSPKGPNSGYPANEQELKDKGV